MAQQADPLDTTTGLALDRFTGGGSWFVLAGAFRELSNAMKEMGGTALKKGDEELGAVQRNYLR